MKKIVLFWIGVLIVLVSIFLMLNTLGTLSIVDPKILLLETGEHSSPVVIPLGIMFVGLFLTLLGISPTQKAGA